jgi:hypothetical protein
MASTGTVDGTLGRGSGWLLSLKGADSVELRLTIRGIPNAARHSSRPASTRSRRRRRSGEPEDSEVRSMSVAASLGVEPEVGSGGEVGGQGERGAPVERERGDQVRP